MDNSTITLALISLLLIAVWWLNNELNHLDARVQMVEHKTEYITGNTCSGKLYSDWPCMNAEGCIKL
jgi:hypothetical protein